VTLANLNLALFIWEFEKYSLVYTEFQIKSSLEKLLCFWYSIQIENNTHIASSKISLHRLLKMGISSSSRRMVVSIIQWGREKLPPSENQQNFGLIWSLWPQLERQAGTRPIWARSNVLSLSNGRKISCFYAINQT